MNKLAHQLLVILAIAIPATALGQVGTTGSRYVPARPTVSPYLNLLRTNDSPIPNYYSLVRPQQQQYRFYEQQQLINQQQQTSLQTQQQGLRTVQEGLLEMRQPQAKATGTGGRFMDYQHYYSFQRSAARRR
jgi:hypothetical protein